MCMIELVDFNEHMLGEASTKKKTRRRKKATPAAETVVEDEVATQTQPEATPFTLKASKSTAPSENWNLTALSNPTAPTVIVFDPSVNATALPKKSLPLAVV